MYDLYVPMVDNVDYPMPYEEGKQLVKKALAPLGEKYAALLDRAFNEHWIDVYENKGKTSGAYSAGVYGVHSFVLLNYTDTLDDAFTLAHELGHAMHSYLSNETQTFANSDYFITVAEVASHRQRSAADQIPAFDRNRPQKARLYPQPLPGRFPHNRLPSDTVC